MKRFTLIFLAFVMLFLVSCQSLSETMEATSPASSSPASSEGEEGPAIEYPTVSNRLNWDRINAIPIANDSMTTDELRQICVDYMYLMLTFEWTPNASMEYVIETYSKPTAFPMGKVYAGLPYNGPEGGPSGNLYTVMRYYDPQTGVLDVASLGTSRITQIISNHCSSACFWAWARVSNTMHNFSDDDNMSGTRNGEIIKKYGFDPIAPCTYSAELDNWYDGDGTKAVCLANGEQTMYRAYANALPADGTIQLFPKGNTQANHVQMFAKKSDVVYIDGTDQIDGENSYVYIHEQGSSPTAFVNAYGETVTIEGRVYNKFSFQTMFEAYYVPFTLKEFHGDPVEAPEVRIETADEGALSFDKLKEGTLVANYAVSNFMIQVTDPTGKVVYERENFPGTINSYRVPMSQILLPAMKRFVTSENKVQITVRLGTGELVTVFDEKIPN